MVTKVTYHQSPFPLETSRAGTETFCHRKPPRCGGVPWRPVSRTQHLQTTNATLITVPHVPPWNKCVGDHTCYHTMKPKARLLKRMKRSYDLKRIRVLPHRRAPKTFRHAFARLASTRRLQRLFPAWPSIPSHGLLERLFSGPNLRSSSAMYPHWLQHHRSRSAPSDQISTIETCGRRSRTE